MRMSLTLGIVLTAALSGCSADSGLPQKARAHEVPVVSEPPGARIEMNGEYIGDTPLTIRMLGINGRVAEDYILRALPVESGSWTQAAAYVHSKTGESSPVPSRIAFDMRLKTRGDNEADLDRNREQAVDQRAEATGSRPGP